MTDTIEAEGLTKRFGGTQALRGVDLLAGPGTVLALLGPNRAGQDHGGAGPGHLAESGRRAGPDLRVRRGH